MDKKLDCKLRWYPKGCLWYHIRWVKNLRTLLNFDLWVYIYQSMILSQRGGNFVFIIGDVYQDPCILH